jgi:hypothetical protein
LTIVNIIYLFYKTSYLNEEVNCTEPSPLLGVPWYMACEEFGFQIEKGNMEERREKRKGISGMYDR